VFLYCFFLLKTSSIFAGKYVLLVLLEESNQELWRISRNFCLFEKKDETHLQLKRWVDIDIYFKLG